MADTREMETEVFIKLKTQWAKLWKVVTLQSMVIAADFKKFTNKVKRFFKSERERDNHQFSAQQTHHEIIRSKIIPEQLIKKKNGNVRTSEPPESCNNNDLDTIMEAKMPVGRESEEYNMSHSKRGLAVIFNNEDFNKNFNSNIKKRNGSEHDVKSLSEVFSLLEFEIKVYKNLKREEITKQIAQLAKHDYSNCDCLVVTVLTHGSTNGFLHAKDHVYSFDELWPPFTADMCPTLAGKPKFFFVQACRGELRDKGVNLIMKETKIDAIKFQPYKIPKTADFLFAFSSVEEFCSHRNEENGTWFIQTLCRVLRERYQTTDLIKMLIIVCRIVATDYESHSNDPALNANKQVPNINSTLIRDVYFKPKVRK